MYPGPQALEQGDAAAFLKLNLSHGCWLQRVVNSAGFGAPHVPANNQPFRIDSSGSNRMFKQTDWIMIYCTLH